MDEALPNRTYADSPLLRGPGSIRVRNEQRRECLEVVQVITETGEEVRWTDSHRHKYSSAMAEYLDMLGGISGEDDSTGSATEWVAYVQLFNKRLLITNDQGFVTDVKYPNSRQAGEAFEAWVDEYNAFDVDEEDVADTIGLWCKLHQSAHQMGGFQCELMSNEAYYGTD